MPTLLPDRTDRVLLRPVRRADRDAIVAANRASLDDDPPFHAPWTAPFTDAAGFDAWFERRVTGPNASLVAFARSGGALVGVVSLTEIVHGPLRAAYLGYYGYRATGGRGLMTEAVRAATRHGFDELGLHRIEANIQGGNHRSIALVRRLGFRQEGVATDYLFLDGAWRECQRWALLAGEADGPDGEVEPPPSAAVLAFWARFRAETGLGTATVCRAVAFGAGAAVQDALAALVLRRRKRATVSLRREYGPGAPVLPAPGDLTVVVDGAGRPVAVIRTGEVRLGPLGSVDDAFAWDEGEGDRTRDGWLRIHRAHYGDVDDDVPVLFERFAVIWPDRDEADPRA